MEKDIFESLTSAYPDNFVSQNPKLFYRPAEKLLTNYVVKKLNNLAKMRACEQCLEYICSNCTDNKQVDITIFDFLMKQYVWHMGEICYEQSKNIIQGIRGLYNCVKLFRNAKNDIETSRWYANYCKAFVNVYRNLNNYTYIILSELFYRYKVISEEKYTLLSHSYILDNHVKFENSIAPIGHCYEGERLIDIILNKNRNEINTYYNIKYDGYAPLHKGLYGDYPDYFFSNTPNIVIGNTNIYKYAHQK